MNEDNKYIKKLIYDLKLHDADIISFKIYDNTLEFLVSCKGMGVNYYFNDLDDVYFKFLIKDIKKLIFDFNGNISITDFSINEKNNMFIISTGDELYIECINLNIEVSLIKKQNVKYDKLDKFLKSKL